MAAVRLPCVTVPAICDWASAVLDTLVLFCKPLYDSTASFAATMRFEAVSLIVWLSTRRLSPSSRAVRYPREARAAISGLLFWNRLRMSDLGHGIGGGEPLFPRFPEALAAIAHVLDVGRNVLSDAGKVVLPRQAESDKLRRCGRQFGERIGQRSHGSKRLLFEVRGLIYHLGELSIEGDFRHGVFVDLDALIDDHLRPLDARQD